MVLKLLYLEFIWLYPSYNYQVLKCGRSLKCKNTASLEFILL